MSEQQFEEGDKVRLLIGYHKGAVVEVKNAAHMGSNTWMFFVDGKDGRSRVNGWYTADQLERE